MQSVLAEMTRGFRALKEESRRRKKTGEEKTNVKRLYLIWGEKNDYSLQPELFYNVQSVFLLMYQEQMELSWAENK